MRLEQEPLGDIHTRGTGTAEGGDGGKERKRKEGRREGEPASE